MTDPTPPTNPTTVPATATGTSVVVYGGTFDPPHAGHVAAARALLNVDTRSSLHVVVAGDPWMKRNRAGMTPAPLRAAMCAAAFSTLDARVVIDLQEVARAAAGTTSTTFDTITDLLRRYDRVKVAVGTDALTTLPRWAHVRRWLPHVTLLVLARPGFPRPALTTVRKQLPAAPGGVQIVAVNGPVLSSTTIRQAFAANQSVAELVPADALAVYRTVWPHQVGLCEHLRARPRPAVAEAVVAGRVPAPS